MGIIMHVDANSAYLSWTAIDLIEKGYRIDIRTVPAVIAGNPENRHGIILAKSIPAKKYKISTGDSLFEAMGKCPELLIFPPDYNLYLSCSDAMFEILSDYTPLVQRYSVDECFIDFTRSEKKFGSPVEVAYEIKKRIKSQLGFTVNIGISTNKLLAKMGSELEKPDKVHSLFLHEIKDKMWPLPIRELFMVGRATARKLNAININTIGDLAKANPEHMKALLKSHGLLVWQYANGIDNSPVLLNEDILQKGVSNSMTISYDVVKKHEVYSFILSLAERVGMRLRRLNFMASLISISVKTDSFVRYSHQLQLSSYIDSTSDIYQYSCTLFDQCWRGEPVRQIGISVSSLTSNNLRQTSLFDKDNIEKIILLDKTVDDIRKKFGETALIRGIFANSEQNPIEGGVNNGDYLMMGGYRS